MVQREKKGTLIKSCFGRVKDENTLMKSSSGGAFSALTDLALNDGDGIVCSIYDYTSNTLNYQFVVDRTDRNRARGSKYFSSNLNTVFREIRKWLNDNPEKHLIFFGLGCEAAGLAKYLEAVGLRSRVIIVDLICHGSCSQKLWKDYLDLQQKKFGRLSYITFKDKRNGWRKPVAIGVFDGQEKMLDEYMELFYIATAHRPSCYDCRFTTKYRYSDITIGDAWGLNGSYGQANDDKGYSLFLIHTKEGLEAFEQCKKSLEYYEIGEEECMQKNLIHPSPMPLFRSEFWKDYEKKGIQFLIKKYTRHPSIIIHKARIKARIQRILRMKEQTLDLSESVRYFGEDKNVSGMPPLLYEKKENCCGCTACYSVCQVNAIVMEEDREGYFYPAINLEKCVRCRRCLTVCPLK